MDIGRDYGYGAVAIGLAAFGLLYNAAVAWLERRGWSEGYTALLVVIGVAATLCGVAVIDWRSSLLSIAAFCITGTPMLLGSVLRYARAREAAQRSIRREVLER